MELPAGVVLVNMTFDRSTRFNDEQMHFVERHPTERGVFGPIINYPSSLGHVAADVVWPEPPSSPKIVNLPDPLANHLFVVEKEVYLVAKLLFPERKDLRFPSGDMVYHEKYEDCLTSFTVLGHFDL